MDLSNFTRIPDDWLIIALAVVAGSFLHELIATGYTLAVSRGNTRLATICTVLLNMLGRCLWIYEAFNWFSIPADILGEAIGTQVAMRIANRKK
jgi:hypothetical protein